MLQAQDIAFSTGGRQLLANVSFRLEAGTLAVLAGPNGAGKSTLLRILCGDARPGSGSVLLNGRALTTWSRRELARQRAVMPQETLLSFSFTAEEVVRMGRHPLATAAAAGRDDDAVVQRSMQATETTHLQQRSFPTLSGGEKARVTLARVLAQESPLIFLDEPTASLDPRHQHMVMQVARQVADAGGSVLAVLHDLNLAALYADTIVLLKQGSVRASGPPDQVLTTATLEDVFDARFEVTRHPRLARPLVLSLPAEGG